MKIKGKKVIHEKLVNFFRFQIWLNKDLKKFFLNNF